MYCIKNNVGNVVSDADGMKNIWRMNMEKLLNVGNDWDGEVDCPEVMAPCCLISEEEVAAAINGLKMGIAAGSTGVVSEIVMLHPLNFVTVVILVRVVVVRLSVWFISV